MSMNDIRVWDFTTVKDAAELIIAEVLHEGRSENWCGRPMRLQEIMLHLKKYDIKYDDKKGEFYRD